MEPILLFTYSYVHFYVMCTSVVFVALRRNKFPLKFRNRALLCLNMATTSLFGWAMVVLNTPFFEKEVSLFFKHLIKTVFITLINLVYIFRFLDLIAKSSKQRLFGIWINHRKQKRLEQKTGRFDRILMFCQRWNLVMFFLAFCLLMLYPAFLPFLHPVTMKINFYSKEYKPYFLYVILFSMTSFMLFVCFLIRFK
ncbi:hypothetical protein MHBO_003118 [Bonamia ostreae]|uniref:NADH dehydrogenase subunit 6 n=1 Tax=Bonamia ostreae TaxID=126728 RepID=A0ABV2API8_9EUKA